MNNWLNNSTFLAYAITCLVLCGNLLFLWGYSGAARAKTKTAMNEEDAIRFSASLAEIDPPKVARVLRAHSNAEASIYPFLFLGLVFVLAGGPAGTGRSSLESSPARGFCTPFSIWRGSSHGERSSSPWAGWPPSPSCWTSSG